MTVKKAVIIGLLLEILIGCLAGVFYFKFYVYTPTYSIRAMQKAMQSGDVEELKNRVDLDGLFKLNTVILTIAGKTAICYLAISRIIFVHQLLSE